MDSKEIGQLTRLTASEHSAAFRKARYIVTMRKLLADSLSLKFEDKQVFKMSESLHYYVDQLDEIEKVKIKRSGNIN